MRFIPTNKASYPVVPKKQRCIWMSAGILSYQLCDREFDCDRCPLDRAMRMHFSHGNREGREGRTPSVTATTSEYLYSRDHCWVRPGDDGVVRVGLEPGFASILVDPKAIALPAIGETVSPGDFCCWIILPGGTIPLRSPVRGRILDTNARITDEPHELCSHPMTLGWLFEVQTGDGAMGEHLLDKEEADGIYAADMTRFKDSVTATLPPNAEEIGLTMADGGQILREVSTMLGPKRYAELVRKAFVSSR
jgi:glycine cleavage system H protein